MNDAPATFIGIDLAWSHRNPSGGAVIRDGLLLASTGELGSDDEIVAFVKQWLPDGAPAVVAVDAPLRVPNLTGSRACDRELSAEWRRFEAGALPANRRLLADERQSAWRAACRYVASLLRHRRVRHGSPANRAENCLRSLSAPGPCQPILIAQDAQIQGSQWQDVGRPAG